MIGYFGVGMPQDLLWQGFFIPDDDSMKAAALDMIKLGREAIDAQDDNYETQLFGALQASLVAGVEARNMGVIAVASRAIFEVMGDPYFYVSGQRYEGGVSTTYQPLNAQTIEEAKTCLQNLPQVQSINTFLALKRMIT